MIRGKQCVTGVGGAEYDNVRRTGGRAIHRSPGFTNVGAGFTHLDGAPDEGFVLLHEVFNLDDQLTTARAESHHS